MKLTTVFLLPAAFLQTAAAGLIPLGEHVDNIWTWNTSSQKWEFTAQGDENAYGPDEVFFPLSDKPYIAETTQQAISGARLIQNTNAGLAFTGVAPGAPIWYALEWNSGLGEAYPGFRNDQSSATIAPYFETDPRLLPQPQNIALPWITSRFTSVWHDGPAAPKFSVWTASTSSPRIWASTSNGQTNNLFLFSAGGHKHVNWTFGATGIYRIGMTASAFLGPNQSMPTGASEEVKVTFAVGPVAFWQCRNFSAPELELPLVSGMNADPDGDGLKNIVEYAFGTDPNGSATPLAPGLGAPASYLENSAEGAFHVISFPRRKPLQLTNPLIYTPQFSHNLALDSWSEVGTETVSAFIGSQTALNAEWEKVEFRRAVSGSSLQKGFARVKLAFTN